MQRAYTICALVIKNYKLQTNYGWNGKWSICKQRQADGTISPVACENNKYCKKGPAKRWCGLRDNPEACAQLCKDSLQLTCADDVMLERILGRGQGRADDNEATARQRIATFHEQGEPIEVLNIGDIMYDEAKDVPAGQILNLPLRHGVRCLPVVVSKFHHERTHFHQAAYVPFGPPSSRNPWRLGIRVPISLLCRSVVLLNLPRRNYIIRGNRKCWRGLAAGQVDFERIVCSGP